ncbi:MAG: TonB-dependent receptor domain-containing protein [Steroidobacteraceae bacterium]
MNIKRALLMSGACGILATAVSTALAQETSEVAEVVIVTGSYIRGTAEDAALPVDVISAEELEKAGSPTTLELLKSLNVSNGVLGDTNQFDARAQGSEGSGTVNLRGLGAARTLVLLNGRRMVVNPFTAAVDTNIIPMAAVGRVEVLKDGAAATYGSDAIGGVVNFITKENQQGVQIGGDYTYLDGSDGNYTANLSYGWKTDRASGLVAAGYQHRSELQILDRDWAFPTFAQSPESGWSGAGNPPGMIVGAGATTRFIADPSCAPLGGVPTQAATAFPLCNWQYTIFDNLTEEENRYQAYADLNLDIGESTSFHVEGLFANTKVPHWTTSPSYAVLQGPTPTSSAYLVPFANPGIQAFIAQHPTVTTLTPAALIALGFPPSTPNQPTAALLANGAALTAPAFRPYALGGNPIFGFGGATQEREYTAFRVSAGLNGDFNDNVSWDVAATYMEEEGRRQARDTVAARLQRALLGFGGPNCTGTTAGANGCLWYNPFGSAVPGGVFNGADNPDFTGAGDNLNPDLINWMFPLYETKTTTDILVVDAVLSGQSGWALGGGNVGWAFGAQYRDNGLKTELDDLNNLAVTPCVNSVDGGTGTCTAATGPFVFLGGAFENDLSGDVYGVFGELSLPLTESFQAQLAARYEDYGGSIGSTFDPKLSLRWQLADAFALRGSVGTTFRGPPINLVGEGSVTSLQNIAGTFRAVDTFDNPNLEPESATTFNVGMILRTGAFAASLDYWSFDFDNPIVVEPVGDIVATLFPNGAAAPNNCNDPAFAGVQGRFTFSGTGACSTTNISRLRVNWVNGAPVKTTGLDLNAQYDWDVGGGTLALGTNVTYILKYEVDAQSVAGVEVSRAFDAVGHLNYQTTAIPLPQLKGNVFVEYSRSGHNLRLVTNYIDSYTDRRTFAVNPGLGHNIDSFVTHDLNYRVDLPWDMRLLASVDNITDEEPPFVRLDLAYDPFTASAIGRAFKLGLSKRFGAE